MSLGLQTLIVRKGSVKSSWVMSSSSNCTSGFGVAIQGHECALKTTFFFVFPIAFVDSKWFELEELSILFTVQLSLHSQYGPFTCRIWRFYAVCHSWSSDPAVSVSSSWSLQTSQSSTILDLTNRWVGCVGPPNLWKTPGNFRVLVSRDCQIYSTPIVQKNNRLRNSAWTHYGPRWTDCNGYSTKIAHRVCQLCFVNLDHCLAG